MRAKEIFEADVVDKSDLFKQKQQSNFIDRVQKLAADMPNVFAHQKTLEEWMAKELSNIKHIPDKAFGKRVRLELAPLYAEYIPGVTLFSVLVFATSDLYWEKRAPKDEKEKLALQFILQNYIKLMQTAEQEKQAMNNLADEANKIKWPAPWQRYTSYGYTWTELNREIDHFKTIKKLFGNNDETK